MKEEISKIFNPLSFHWIINIQILKKEEEMKISNIFNPLSFH